MMDPLDVATSLVGLLGSAGKVAALLLAVRKGISEAPQMMDQMISQVGELQISLSAVQSFLLGISSASRGRISMIRVEQLVAILTEAVLTFSELEALVTSIVQDKGRLPIMSRLMSLWKEDVVTSIMLRMERHKSSLSLMLNIAQCESVMEAEQSRETLQSLVEQLLKSNHDISIRLQSIEENLETRSVLTYCYRNGSMPEVPEEELQAEPVSQQSDLDKLHSKESNPSDPDFKDDQIGFHVDLGASRVYRRTDHYKSDVSFTSSAIRTHAWSVFSGLSLSEVSVISAIALPLYLDEIYNSSWYTLRRVSNDTFKAMSHTTVPQDPSSIASDSFFNAGAGFSVRENTPQPSPEPKDQDAAAGPGKMELHKLVMLGDSGVGKTKLVYWFIYRELYDIYDPTIEDSYRKSCLIDGQACMLEILDTAGVEEYTALQDEWIKDGEGFILVYNITSRGSFEHVQRLHHQVVKNKGSSSLPASLWALPPRILVGNDCYRTAERVVSTQEGQALARQLGCDFVEASVNSGINVDKVFYDAVRDLRRQKLLETLRTAPIQRQAQACEAKDIFT